ncbi:DUF7546 family protein [Candidatus Halobonum tyrrellensis]|uniref:Uncharacterized protein n=1 Tax=Candidatus Halobonum tyrrellensis G22 TaxID=1324957 RepID=V4HCQ4_9EURY|nr:hypothetical protein [Candidatus Halobonum tyrrellensis]ESP88485.1 hypothetical protein K933_08497 [Candidatus Halobonum tyrrellensis G22]
MSTASLTVAGRDLTLSRRDLLVATLAFNLELAAVVAYFGLTNATMTSPLFTLYGLVWVDVALFVFARYDPPSVDAATRRRAAAAAVGYAVLLAYFGGLVGAAAPTTPSGLGVALLPPGWGPAVTYGGSALAFVLMPAKVLGYAALAYLLYGALVAASGAGVAGVLGLFSCVSCSFPIVAGAAASLLGGGSTLAAAAAGIGYGPSTAVFLLTVGLLWWRPGFDALSRLRESAN